jgi:hypothetical protein
MHIYQALQHIAILAATMLYLFLVTRGFLNNKVASNFRVIRCVVLQQVGSPGLL